MELAVAVGTVTTPWAGSPPEIAAATTDIGLGQVLDAGNALGGIGSVFTGSWHDVSPGRNLPGNTHATTILFTDLAR